MPGDPPLLNALLHESHLAVPDALPALVRSHATRLGADRAVVYLADLDQRWLMPLTTPGSKAPDPVSIDATLAGRCFRDVAVIDASADPHHPGMWVPLLDGTERLGALQLSFTDRVADVEEVKAFATLIAELVMTKGTYGDFFEIARRRQPLTVSSELLWQLLPPLTFGTEGLVISAAFTPTDRLGGDAFDYGVDHTSAQMAIFDAVGHDLVAGLLATVAVAAYRNARRSRLPLHAVAAQIGSTIAEHFDETKFVTGIVATLDSETGRLSWSIAGHPPPLLLRNRRVVKELDRGRGQPFGIGASSDVVHEQLERGDRILFYTDGVTEARDADGSLFQLDKLIDLISRTSGEEPLPETLRRLMHTIEDHSHGPLRDDATVVLVEWRGGGVSRLEL